VEIVNHNDWFDRIKLFPMFIGDKNGVVSILTEKSGTFVVRYEKEDPNFKIVKNKDNVTSDVASRIATIDDFTWIAEMGNEDEKYGLDMVFEDKKKERIKIIPALEMALTWIL